MRCHMRSGQYGNWCAVTPIGHNPPPTPASEIGWSPTQRALIAAVTVSSAHLQAASVLQNVEQEAATLVGRMLVSANVEWIE